MGRIASALGSSGVDRKQIEDAFAWLLAKANQSASHPARVYAEELTESGERSDGIGVRAEDPSLDFSVGEARDVPVQHLATVGLDTIRIHCPKQPELARATRDAAIGELLGEDDIRFEHRARIPAIVMRIRRSSCHSDVSLR